jgi:N-formylglutamate amidohydrolase
MIARSRLAVLTIATFLHDAAGAQEKTSPAQWLTVGAGDLPIVVAAPHGGREAIPRLEARRGVGVPQFSAARDNNTAELAELFVARLAARLGAKPYLVIARFERRQVDANRPETAAFESAAAKPYYDAYHAALAGAVLEVRRRWGAGLLLDIHGQGAERDTIYRGTDHGRSVAALQKRFGGQALTGSTSLLGHMASKGYRIEPAGDHREVKYTGGYTTRVYGSHTHTGIDAIQLEFGTSLRSKSNLERTADDLAAAVAAFARSYLPVESSRESQQSAAQP